MATVRWMVEAEKTAVVVGMEAWVAPAGTVVVNVDSGAVDSETPSAGTMAGVARVVKETVVL